LHAIAVANPSALERDTDIIRRALAGVARTRAAAGMQNVAAMLRGDHSDRVSRLGLDRLSTFGVLSSMGHDQIMVVLRALLAAGWVDLTTSDFPVPIVTEAGWRVMRGDHPPRMRLPASAYRTPQRRSGGADRGTSARSSRGHSDGASVGQSRPPPAAGVGG